MGDFDSFLASDGREFSSPERLCDRVWAHIVFDARLDKDFR